MYKLNGEYECKVDDKGRLRLPGNLLRQYAPGLDRKFILNRGMEKCLVLYSTDVWEQKCNEVATLNHYSKKQRDFIRYFHRGATQVALDASDRMLIPKNLMEHAAIISDVILLAYQDIVEVWSKQDYLDMIKNEPENFGELAEEVFGQIKKS